MWYEVEKWDLFYIKPRFYYVTRIMIKITGSLGTGAVYLTVDGQISFRIMKCLVFMSWNPYSYHSMPC